ncbi:MAG: hypothetical protein ACE5G2_07840 [Candidatus Krumholzibacteriia bacterium]
MSGRPVLLLSAAVLMVVAVGVAPGTPVPVTRCPFHAGTMVGTGALAPPAASEAVRAAPSPKGAAAEASEKPRGSSATRDATAPAPYTVLENRLTLREPFNRDSGKIRVIAFLSPSCPRCQVTAGQFQRDVLDKNDTEELSVFLVWLKALQKDTEEALTTMMGKVSDPRVQHFWDPERVLNHQLLDAIMFDVQLRIYDVYLLYDREAKWEKRLPRPGFWMHEVKGAPGPRWDIDGFAAQVDRGLRGETFSDPYN